MPTEWAANDDEWVPLSDGKIHAKSKAHRLGGHLPECGECGVWVNAPQWPWAMGPYQPQVSKELFDLERMEGGASPKVQVLNLYAGPCRGCWNDGSLSMIKATKTDIPQQRISEAIPAEEQSS